MLCYVMLSLCVAFSLYLYVCVWAALRARARARVCVCVCACNSFMCLTFWNSKFVSVFLSGQKADSRGF